MIDDKVNKTYQYLHDIDATGQETRVRAYGDANGSSELVYNANHQLVTVNQGKGDGKDRSEITNYIYNADNQIISKIHDDGKHGVERMEYHYTNGNIQAQTGVDAEGKNQSKIDTGNYAMFQMLDDAHPGSISHYTIRTGDTLQSIASAVYGTSSLWYLIADANGLNADSSLTDGSVITIPNTAQTGKIDSNRFKVYNQGEIEGSKMPNLVLPGDRCGALSQLIGLVVSAVVIYFTGNVALGAMAGNAATQYSAAAFNGRLDWGDLFKRTLLDGVDPDITHVIYRNRDPKHMPGFTENEFNWKSTVIAGAAAYVGGQLANGSTALSGSTFGAVVGRAVVTNVVSQGLSIAAHQQNGFEWKGLAKAGVSAGVSYGVGNVIGQSQYGSERWDAMKNNPQTSANLNSLADSQRDWGNTFVRSAAGDIVGNVVGDVVTTGRPHWQSAIVNGLGSAAIAATTDKYVEAGKTRTEALERAWQEQNAPTQFGPTADVFTAWRGAERAKEDARIAFEAQDETRRLSQRGALGSGGMSIEDWVTEANNQASPMAVILQNMSPNQYKQYLANLMLRSKSVPLSDAATAADLKGEQYRNAGWPDDYSMVDVGLKNNQIDGRATGPVRSSGNNIDIGDGREIIGFQSAKDIARIKELQANIGELQLLKKNGDQESFSALAEKIKQKEDGAYRQTKDEEQASIRERQVNYAKREDAASAKLGNALAIARQSENYAQNENTRLLSRFPGEANDGAVNGISIKISERVEIEKVDVQTAANEDDPLTFVTANPQLAKKVTYEPGFFRGLTGKTPEMSVMDKPLDARENVGQALGGVARFIAGSIGEPVFQVGDALQIVLYNADKLAGNKPPQMTPYSAAGKAGSRGISAGEFFGNQAKGFVQAPGNLITNVVEGNWRDFGSNLLATAGVVTGVVGARKSALSGNGSKGLPPVATANSQVQLNNLTRSNGNGTYAPQTTLNRLPFGQQRVYGQRTMGNELGPEALQSKKNDAPNKASPLDPVLEFENGNEVHYRTMSPKHYKRMERTGKIPATGETSISPLEIFSRNYDGVLVKIVTKPGTSSKLQEIGIAGNSTAEARFPAMSTNSIKWNESNAQFKGEGKGIPVLNNGAGMMTTQLGKGNALTIYNGEIVSFEPLYIIDGKKITKYRK
ncbi:MAG: LysM peptidoglycan-binding domain-containing protein [Pseudomonadota bacterium]